MTTRAPAEPATAPPTGDIEVPGGPTFGLSDDGFRIRLGSGLTIESSEFGRNSRARFEFDPTDSRARAVPGLLLKSVSLGPRGGHVDADLAVPMVDGDLRVSISGVGVATVSGRARASTDMPSLGNPSVTLTMDEEGTLGGTLEVDQTSITPPGRRNGASATLGGSVTIRNGRFSGNLDGTLAYERLGSGALQLRFSEEGMLSGSGHFELDTPIGNGARMEISVDEAGAVTGTGEVPAASVAPEVGGLSVPEGTIRLGYSERQVTGGLEGVKLVYAGLGETTVNAAIENGQFTGNGEIAVTIPSLADVSGTWAYAQGALSGSVTLDAIQFPDALQISEGSITAALGPTGAMSFSGHLQVGLGPAGSGQLRASYSEDGQMMIGATVDLTIPGLNGAQFSITYVNGALEGSAEIPIASDAYPGIEGNVLVEYRENRWSGETSLHYEADNGKLSGTITINVAQTEDGGLQVGGSGEVTAQIAPRLSGSLRATLNPDQTIDVSGQITVTEPLELFPEWRTDRELFRISQNIPLWAILVAVIRVRGGVRAGIGPGVFRDVTVTGEYTIGEDGEPTFTISGEMFVPAFVEAYVAFGAGLGLDVALGSLTGGIEGVATAGIYGAVSVIPELSYENGDYKIEGTATLAAGARLKVGLNAWAEVEALWVTVWDQTWELAEWVWSVGPDLGLQARMSYNFSNPAPPTIEFNTSDIDTDRLIRDAMPEDGPAGSGAREAMENRAEWSGPARAAGRDAQSVPADLAGQAQTPAVAPDAPARPPRDAPPPGVEPGVDPDAQRPPSARAEPSGNGDRGGAASDRPDSAPAPRGTGAAEPPPPGSARDRDIVDAATPAPPETAIADSDVPDTDQPRYARPLSLQTLDEDVAETPRSRAQQDEDLAAASAVVSAVESTVDDTDALVAYFPRIRRRFALRRIDLVSEGRGATVEMEINPLARNPVNEKLRGRDLTRDDGLDLATEVDFFTGSLGGATVGTRMIATLLGPDHPEGSGPSAQADLMAKLPSRTGDEAQNFIRGHLLNDNLGGPGIARNLFPITQQANRMHEQSIENQVKRWVNDDKYWVAYTVDVDMQDHNLSNNDRNRNYVTATFSATAAVLTTSRSRLLTRNVVIRSRANLADAVAASGATAPVPAVEVSGEETVIATGQTTAIDGTLRRSQATATTEAETLALAGHAATAFDAATEVALPQRNSASYILNGAISGALSFAAGRRPGAVAQTVRAAVESVPRLGPTHATLVLRFLGGDLASKRAENVYSDLADARTRATMTQINNKAAQIDEAIRRTALS